jgi:DNA repair exonuclease SbcCD ATPase subunit
MCTFFLRYDIIKKSIIGGETMSNAADPTWSVRMPAELKERITTLIEQSGVSGKDFMAEIIQVYEMNQVKETVPIVEADAKELQGITRRINEIFVNIAERIKSIETSKQSEYEREIAEKENYIKTQQERLSQLREKAHHLEQENAELLNTSIQIREKTNTVSDANETLKALTKEYEEKNKALIEQLEHYKECKNENEYLLKEVNRLNQKLQEKEKSIIQYQTEIKKREAAHNDALEKSLSKAQIEHEKNMLMIQRGYEDQINKLRNENADRLERYLHKIGELEEKLAQAREGKHNR